MRNRTPTSFTPPPRLSSWLHALGPGSRFAHGASVAQVDEKNVHYVDAAITVPKGVLYPLCSMNVAFDRELIGPAFMQGLMGVGQPWGR